MLNSRFGRAIGLSLALFAGHSPALAQGEFPNLILNITPFPGGLANDITYDALNNLVHVVDTTTGITHTYSSTLAPISSTPSAFPAGSLVTGITADPLGTVYWSVINGSNTNLWSAPSLSSAATLVGPLAIPGSGGVALGIDSDSVALGTIYVNDPINTQVSIHDATGALVGTTCGTPGLATGISYRSNSFVDLSVDLLGVGVSTHMIAVDTSTCAQLDAVGIPIYAAATPPITATSFDHGPIVGGRPTLYLFEVSTGSLMQVAVHRSFIRGDANSDCTYNIADALFIINWLFTPGAPAPTCEDAADANDSSTGPPDIADVIYILTNLFGPGLPPPAPYPGCGQDPTPDTLRCDLTCALCP